MSCVSIPSRFMARSPHVAVGGNGVELRGIQIVEAGSGEPMSHPIFNRDYFQKPAFEARDPVRDAMVLAEVEDETGVAVSDSGTVEEGVASVCDERAGDGPLSPRRAHAHAWALPDPRQRLPLV